MVKDLNSILEMQFDLLYYLRVSVTEYNEMDIQYLNWFHSRLVKQKNEELKGLKK